MPKLSELISKAETWASEKISERFPKLKERWKTILPLFLCGLYFYGMILNSIILGNASTMGSETVGSIWVVNPFKNLFAIFTPAGIIITAIGVLLFCLITKKGYFWFSGYKYTKDPRGFDILPDGTHGSSGFMPAKEMAAVLDCKPVAELDGTILGKQKSGRYISLKKPTFLNDHTLVYGASGTGKSRGFVRPFIWQTIRRGESLILVDPKGEVRQEVA